MGLRVLGNSKIQLGKEDLDALRKKWNVPETNTIAVGKTYVKGLRDLAFEGGSQKLEKKLDCLHWIQSYQIGRLGLHMTI